MLSITAVMILPPYLACTLFLWKICANGSFPEHLGLHRGFALLCGIAGSIYAIWMIYAAGLQYLLAAFCFMVLGIPVFIWARKSAMENDPQQEDSCIFTGKELLAVALMLITAGIAIIAMATDKITL